MFPNLQGESKNFGASFQIDLLVLSDCIKRRSFALYPKGDSYRSVSWSGYKYFQSIFERVTHIIESFFFHAHKCPVVSLHMSKHYYNWHIYFGTAPLSSPYSEGISNMNACSLDSWMDFGLGVGIIYPLCSPSVQICIGFRTFVSIIPSSSPYVGGNSYTKAY